MYGVFATNIDHAPYIFNSLHLTSLIPFFERLYTKCFQLSDVLDYVKTGVAAIIEDEVSGILPF